MTELELIPPDVAERLAYFTALLRACQQARHPHDAAQVLRSAYERQKVLGMDALEDFMERLPVYVLAELPDELREQLRSGVVKSIRGQVRLLRLQPENWPFWHEIDRGRLEKRQQEMRRYLADIESGGRAEADRQSAESWRARHGEQAAADIAHASAEKLVADEGRYRVALDYISRILTALDAASAAGQLVVNAHELMEREPLGTSEPAEVYSSLVTTPTLAESIKKFLPEMRQKLELAAAQSFVNQQFSDVPEQLPQPTSVPWASALSAPQTEAIAAANPFAPLLLNYSLADLTALLAELGLLTTAAGRATPAASPGAWVGVVHGLLNAPRPRLRNNMAAIRRALVEVFGARVSESLLQAGVSKRGSESEGFKDRTLALLAAPAAGD